MVLSKELEADLQRERREMIREEVAERAKKKPTNIYKLAQQVRKDYEAEEKYKQQLKEIKRLRAQRGYAQSRSGRFTKGVTRVFRGIKHPARSSYRYTAEVARGAAVSRYRTGAVSRYPQHIYPSPPSMNMNAGGGQNIPPAILKRLRQARAGINRASDFAVKSPQQQEFDFIFSNFTGNNNIPAQLESEIVRYPRSAGRIGDDESRVVGDLALLNGMEMINYPSRSVSRESSFHANTQHIQPVLDVEREALAFAHVLSPRKASGGRRRINSPAPFSLTGGMEADVMNFANILTPARQRRRARRRR